MKKLLGLLLAAGIFAGLGLLPFRAVDAARQYKKPVRYFTCASAAGGVAQLMKADMK